MWMKSQSRHRELQYRVPQWGACLVCFRNGKQPVWQDLVSRGEESKERKARRFAGAEAQRLRVDFSPGALEAIGGLKAGKNTFWVNQCPPYIVTRRGEHRVAR